MSAAAAVDDVDNDLSRLYDSLNLTGRVIRLGNHIGAGGCAGVFERARRGRGGDSGRASWTGTSAGEEELEEECGYASSGSVASAMTGLISGSGSTFV